MYIQDELLSLKQACELLKCSPSFIYKRIKSNNIPYSRVSKRLYFSKIKLMEWVLSNGGKNV